jgi:glutamyl-tRNA reductase
LLRKVVALIFLRGVGASASLEERERLLQEWELAGPGPRVFLSTCDRVEIYEGEGYPEAEVLAHLFRVVSGLESPLLGENQIQNQVKSAYEEARRRAALPSGLHKMFQAALRVGKRVRTETKLSRGAVGHSQIVMRLLEQKLSPNAGLKVVLIGVNKQTLGILRFLKERANCQVFLVNRTVEKAQAVCHELQFGLPHTLGELSRLLTGADVLVSATSAPGFLVHAHEFPTSDFPKLIFDLAVPRDVDPLISQNPEVQLYNVTALEKEAAKTLEDRGAEVLAAEAIIRQEVEKFFHTSGSLVSR